METKKIKIRLEYKNKVYESNSDEFTSEQENELIELIKKSAIGELNHLSFGLTLKDKFIKNQFYFPSKVLKKSIITIIYLEEE